MARMGHRSTAAALHYHHATRERDRTIAEGLGAMVDGARRTFRGLRLTRSQGPGRGLELRFR